MGTGVLSFPFAGDTLREFLGAFFEDYDVQDLIIAVSDLDRAAQGWATPPEELPGVWRKDPSGERTRRYARVTVNGVFNEHLDGLDRTFADDDRVGLLSPFVVCI